MNATAAGCERTRTHYICVCVRSFVSLQAVRPCSGCSLEVCSLMFASLFVVAKKAVFAGLFGGTFQNGSKNQLMLRKRGMFGG